MTSRRLLVPMCAALVATACPLLFGCGDASVGSTWHPGSSGRPGGGGGVVTGSGNGVQGAGTGTSPGTTAGGGTGGNPVVGGSDAGISTNGTDAGAPVQAATYEVSLDKPTNTVELFAATSFAITVAPNGYRGTVILTTKDLPSDVTVAFDKSAFTLDGTTRETAKLTLTTLSSSKPGDAPFSVVAESEGGTKAAAATLSVASVLTIHVPSGVDQNGGSNGNPVRTAFGTYPIVISAPANLSSQAPVKIRFYNDDNVPHQIHASSPNAGFPHGNGPFDPATYENTQRDVNMKGTYDFYLHDQNGPATVGRIVIQ